MIRIRALSFLALSSLALPAAAGSFYLPASDSVAALGRGYAGQAALGYDATSVMSNPAAMTDADGVPVVSFTTSAAGQPILVLPPGPVSVADATAAESWTTASAFFFVRSVVGSARVSPERRNGIGRRVSSAAAA